MRQLIKNVGMLGVTIAVAIARAIVAGAAGALERSDDDRQLGVGEAQHPGDSSGGMSGWNARYNWKTGKIDSKPGIGRALFSRDRRWD